MLIKKIKSICITRIGYIFEQPSIF